MEKVTRKSIRVYTRKLNRSVAHANMKKMGVVKANKCEYSQYYSITGALVNNRLGSYFSRNWKKYADMQVINV